MIILKILAAPFVVALTLLVAIVSFLYCVASALCHIGCVVLTLLALVLFIGGQTLGRRGVPCAGVPRFALWHPGHR